MVVQHNLPAMNSHRQLGINNSGTAKNLEKLSSGFRINRAGDDAAGLAISEKMRGQIRGLDMATTNAENGVSLIQTAEGGLNETHSILQRMRELAVQSSNGTYADDVDRENIDKEVQALKDEIDRISSSTHYNGINLLDGTMGGTTVKAAKENPAVGEQFNKDIGALGLGDSSSTLTLSNENAKEYAGQSAKIIVSGGGEGGATVATLQIGDKTFKLNEDGTKFYGLKPDGSGETMVIATLDIDGSGGGFKAEGASMSGVFSINSAETISTNAAFNGNDKNKVATQNSQLIFQIGANGAADQRVGLHVGNMGTGNLGSTGASANVYLGGQKVVDVDVSTREKANESIKVLDDAINQVSGTRADLGALQNRLEHTINNLGTTKENLQAAESSIRDVDMAKEMMEFTKNNILVQASQSMLAQSNQLPQGVLSLLR